MDFASWLLANAVECAENAQPKTLVDDYKASVAIIAFASKEVQEAASAVAAAIIEEKEKQKELEKAQKMAAPSSSEKDMARPRAPASEEDKFANIAYRPVSGLGKQTTTRRPKTKFDGGSVESPFR